MSDDIESQLANLTIQLPVTEKKKENDYVYLCKKCKWNVISLILTIGVFVWNGINIKIIVDQEDSNKELGLVVCNVLILLIKLFLSTRSPLYQSTAV